MGTWTDDFDGVALKFDADGTCVEKDAGYTADACTYSVSTGGVNNPASNQSWMVQVSAKDYGETLEIVAIDAQQFTVRDGSNLIDYARASDDEVKDCVGPGSTCSALDTQESCEGLIECGWDSGYCYGDAWPCIELAASECNTYPGCHLQ